MKKDTSADTKASTASWEMLEKYAGLHVQSFIPGAAKEEVTVLLGRAKSERREAVGAPAGYRNGYGKPRRPAG